MEPIHFHYKRSALQRRMAISAVMIVAAAATFALVASQSWVSGTSLFAAVFFACTLVRDGAALAKSPPVITIDDEGIRNPYVGHDVIPWPALYSIRATRPKDNSGGALFLISDAAALNPNADPVAVRAAKGADGRRPGRADEELILEMTPLVMIDATQDDVLKAIAARAQGSDIPVEWVG